MMLCRSMSDSDLYHIDVKDRAKDAWKELQDLFKTTSVSTQLVHVLFEPYVEHLLQPCVHVIGCECNL